MLWQFRYIKEFCKRELLYFSSPQSSPAKEGLRAESSFKVLFCWRGLGEEILKQMLSSIFS